MVPKFKEIFVRLASKLALTYSFLVDLVIFRKELMSYTNLFFLACHVIYHGCVVPKAFMSHIEKVWSF